MRDSGVFGCDVPVDGDEEEEDDEVDEEDEEDIVPFFNAINGSSPYNPCKANSSVNSFMPLVMTKRSNFFKKSFTLFNVSCPSRCL